MSTNFWGGVAQKIIADLFVACVGPMLPSARLVVRRLKSRFAKKKPILGGALPACFSEPVLPRRQPSSFGYGSYPCSPSNQEGDGQNAWTQSKMPY